MALGGEKLSFAHDVSLQVEARGWFRYPLKEEDFDEALEEARRACASEFVRLTEQEELTAASVTTTGQYGFTADGNESQGPVGERRSHLVLHQALPEDHPLSGTQPLFYGPVAARELSALVPSAPRLSALLDYLTMQTVEQVEQSLGLPFGELAAELALGERLLRFQWYPALPDGGEVEVVPFRVGGATLPVRGYRLDRLRSDAAPVVRASPHVDIGHWTWQVYASDDGLRFWDRERRKVEQGAPGRWLYGNSCEFLEMRDSRLQAPLHWVDVIEGSATRNRLSISYFAHARPTARLAGSTAGEALYSRLEGLGYNVGTESDEVTQLLASSEFSEPDLIKRLLDFERMRGVPEGYSAGIGRYFATVDGTLRRIPRQPSGMLLRLPHLA